MPGGSFLTHARLRDALQSPVRPPRGLSYEMSTGRLRRSLLLGDVEVCSFIDGFDLSRLRAESLHGLWWKLRMEGWVPAPDMPCRTRLRVVDLFCGAGGLGVGLTQLAHETGGRVITTLAADTDSDATAVYARNHRTRMTLTESVASLVDYRTRGRGDRTEFVYPPEFIDAGVASVVADADLVMAGPPCQGHSNLNNHSRRTDRRNDLYLHVPAVAVACNARAVLIENVPSVVHAAAGVVEATKRLLSDAGYRVVDGVLGAATMGWPQTRRRHFLVARRECLSPPIALEEIEETLAFASPLPLEWAIGGEQGLSTDGLLHEVPDYSEQNRSRIQYLFDNDEHDLPDAERPECHQDGTSYGSVYGRMRADLPAPTITTGFLTPGRGRFIHPSEPRTVSPAEAARLQGFPDDYVFRSSDRSSPTRSQLSKWIGDAVPMPLAYAAALSAVGADLAAGRSDPLTA